MSAPAEIAYGVPASQLSDDELEHQGNQAHATRHWVFLHGTADQFRRHTERMLELEQEYLRRHPKRTWQGSGGADGEQVDLAGIDVVSQVRFLTRTYATAMESLLARAPQPENPPAEASLAVDVARDLLRRYAAAPDGRLHKLEAHQAAREIGVAPAAVAALYKADPPLLVTAGEYRQITPAGRARIEYA
ncbi:DUF6158 family protein [Sporichthya sp.]|uniref:DUF6158 family protein n=1 Tax=Sporichthya sp. TaxID=65475 RepID=UPI00181098A5|nr:DUF6158 family protein [Sporichthya sp.]MBA3745311.1 hypothetical protein [Sporichthya sp.]